jgi:hypothetical protein
MGTECNFLERWIIQYLVDLSIMLLVRNGGNWL